MKAFRQYTTESDLNRSCPAVSQNWNLQLFPSSYTFLQANSTPMVQIYSCWKVLWTIRLRRLVLPTKASPIKTTLIVSEMSFFTILIYTYLYACLLLIFYHYSSFIIMSIYDQQEEEYGSAKVASTQTLRRSNRPRVPSRNNMAIIEMKKASGVVDQTQPKYLECQLPSTDKIILIELILQEPQNSRELPSKQSNQKKSGGIVSTLLQQAMMALEQEPIQQQNKGKKVSKVDRDGHIQQVHLRYDEMEIDHSAFGRVKYPLSKEWSGQQMQALGEESELLEKMKEMGGEGLKETVGQINFLKQKLNDARKKFKPEIDVR